MFEIGEKVVHPQHGVGEIFKLEDKEFKPGNPHKYYEVSLLNGSTIWIQVEDPNSGLRHLATQREIANCRKILADKPVRIMVDGRMTQAELVAPIKQGAIAAKCEFVRDMSAHLAHKPPYGTIGSLLAAIQAGLCQEWAIVEGVSIFEATEEIESLLEQSKSKITRK